jgi:hypothetical protein
MARTEASTSEYERIVLLEYGMHRTDTQNGLMALG